MDHDTTRDPRILLARRACGLLERTSKQKAGVAAALSRDRIAGLISRCESAVMTLMYMYQPPDLLAASQPVAEIAAAGDALVQAYAPLLNWTEDGSPVRANLRWCLRILGGLGARFTNSGANLASGIDLVVVEVQNLAVQGTFRVTRVGDGTAAYTVVTNLAGVATRHRLAAAFLPPREVGGVVSEAMFLGDRDRLEAVGTLLDSDREDVKEAVAILYEEVGQPR